MYTYVCMYVGLHQRTYVTSIAIFIDMNYLCQKFLQPLTLHCCWCCLNLWLNSIHFALLLGQSHRPCNNLCIKLNLLDISILIFVTNFKYFLTASSAFLLSWVNYLDIFNIRYWILAEKLLKLKLFIAFSWGAAIWHSILVIFYKAAPR